MDEKLDYNTMQWMTESREADFIIQMSSPRKNWKDATVFGY